MAAYCALDVLKATADGGVEMAVIHSERGKGLAFTSLLDVDLPDPDAQVEAHAPGIVALVEEFFCADTVLDDAPFVPEGARFRRQPGSRRPTEMSWRGSRGRLHQMANRKRNGRWRWERVR